MVSFLTTIVVFFLIVQLQKTHSEKYALEQKLKYLDISPEPRKSVNSNEDSLETSTLDSVAINEKNLCLVLEEILPIRNKEEGKECYSDLVSELRENDIAIMIDLKKLINRYLTEEMREDKTYVDMMIRNGIMNDRTINGVFFNHTELLRRMLKKMINDNRT